jgi:hypothetical protein
VANPACEASSPGCLFHHASLDSGTHQPSWPRPASDLRSRPEAREQPRRSERSSPWDYPGTTPVPDYGDRSQAPAGHFWPGNRLRISTNHPGPAHDLVSLADVHTWQADRIAQKQADRLKAANATRQGHAPSAPTAGGSARMGLKDDRSYLRSIARRLGRFGLESLIPYYFERVGLHEACSVL